MIKIKNYILYIVLILVFSLISSCKGQVGNNPITSLGNLTVKVIDEATSAPIASARVSLKKDDIDLGKIQTTDRSGITSFDSILAGDGYVAFVNNAVGYKASASSVIKVEGNTEKIVPLRRLSQGEGTGMIFGSVKDKDTKLGISKLMISYVGPNRSIKYQPVYTDESGRYVLEGLIQGGYVLNYVKAGYQKIQKNVMVKEGDSTSIETIYLAREGAGATTSGNTIISLNGAQKVVEIDKSGKVVWSYNKLQGVENAIRLYSGETLITDSTASKVFVVNPAGSSVMSFGSSGIFSSTFKYPSWVDAKDTKTILVTDSQDNKVIEMVNNTPTWTYGTSLFRPRSAVYLQNGNILIADTGNQRVLEVSKQGKIVWSFDKFMDKPVHAIRLSNDNTLITDSGFSRVIEVSKSGTVVWWFGVPATEGNGSSTDNSETPTDEGNSVSRGGEEETIPAEGAQCDLQTGICLPASTNASSVKSSSYYNSPYYTSYKTKGLVNAYGSETSYQSAGKSLLFPRSATRLSTGNTLIADTGNNRILEVSKAKEIIWELNNLSRPVSVERL